jgi:hypothetical protein
LKSRTSLICFLACFLPGQAKDLSATWYRIIINLLSNEPILSVGDRFDFCLTISGNLNSKVRVPKFLGKT